MARSYLVKERSTSRPPPLWEGAMPPTEHISISTLLAGMARYLCGVRGDRSLLFSRPLIR